MTFPSISFPSRFANQKPFDMCLFCAPAVQINLNAETQTANGILSPDLLPPIVSFHEISHIRLSLFSAPSCQISLPKAIGARKDGVRTQPQLGLEGITRILSQQSGRGGWDVTLNLNLLCRSNCNVSAGPGPDACAGRDWDLCSLDQEMTRGSVSWRTPRSETFTMGHWGQPS